MGRPQKNPTRREIAVVRGKLQVLMADGRLAIITHQEVANLARHERLTDTWKGGVLVLVTKLVPSLLVIRLFGIFEEFVDTLLARRFPELDKPRFRVDDKLTMVCRLHEVDPKP